MSGSVSPPPSMFSAASATAINSGAGATSGAALAGVGADDGADATSDGAGSATGGDASGFATTGCGAGNPMRAITSARLAAPCLASSTNADNAVSRFTSNCRASGSHVSPSAYRAMSPRHCSMIAAASACPMTLNAPAACASGLPSGRISVLAGSRNQRSSASSTPCRPRATSSCTSDTSALSRASRAASSSNCGGGNADSDAGASTLIFRRAAMFRARSTNPASGAASRASTCSISSSAVAPSSAAASLTPCADAPRARTFSASCVTTALNAGCPSA